ncbi:3-hydroxyacyl-ACP dehydratase FabZ family protein [Zavarzinella formosa]|uniref:3-hydroxyacyl-ACP dehydratase FabZ family protein n=1 Tax=Zavarzinella formosa TaxID=360055 RepID=UPI0002FF8FD6|nr:3-hydroxyacyl-ACP dehydratase FabZ family protein [Zavarzinella formosa]
MMRWIWIDRFTAFESGKSAQAVKNLSLAEDHFADHFPGFPVMPAPLMLEGLAQTGGILVGEANGYAKNVILAKIPKASFKREARAGERLTYTTTLEQLGEVGGLVSGTVHVGDELIGEAEIFFAHVDPSQTKDLLGEDNFVFTGQLQKMLGLAKAASKVSPPA